MPKQKKATKSVDEVAATVKFIFTAGGEFVAALSKIPPAIQQRLTLHGLSQKLGDTYASDVESPEHEVRDMFNELAGGHWSTRVAGEPRITLLAEAIATLRPKEGVKHEDRVKQATSWLEEATDEQRANLRKDPQVKANVAAIQARRAREAAHSAPKIVFDF